ncbi:hypothetical protein IMCC3317_45920 [Kordia antarctica]|uniref:Uncharacterized protein n=1 Tax=Kordia antarctica TaxID=1218801 RepID=A0A7L4ZRP6_9FLAO|nr:hypothetical protein [Kordia antarctica]QHI39187.1 hypothetical protein IMCC3317_45920 [Kordia antarctica]
MSKNTKVNEIAVFPHRRDKEYLAFLKERMSIHGENGLINRAIDVPKEWQERTEHKKMCQISYLGVSADIFFDQGRNFITDGNEVLVKEMENIIKNHKIFEDKGVWLRIRFLFIYPFSNHAMSIINAEMTHQRCEINGDWRHPSDQTEFQVDWRKFYASTFMRAQRLTLNHIQNWINQYSFFNERGNRSIIVRFTPISPNVCSLIINDTIVSDSYLFAKLNRHSESLIYKHPIVKVERSRKNSPAYNAFQYLMDHFQYLWQLNITMDCGDATKYIKGKKESLSEINLPSDVSFRLKATRLVNQDCIGKEEKQSWILKTKNQFKRYSSIPEKTNEEEKIFISCSWVENNPHYIPKKIHFWIEEDFTNNSITSLKPVLIDGRPSELISQKIYEGLNVCKLAIVFLTNDIPLKVENDKNIEYISRPNIYHELGFLMNKFDVLTEKGKLFIASERRELKHLSNVKNFIHVPMIEENIELKTHSIYTQILIWLYENSILLEQNLNVLQEVVRNHKDRIVQLTSKIEGGNKVLDSIVKFEKIVDARKDDENLL